MIPENDSRKEAECFSFYTMKYEGKMQVSYHRWPLWCFWAWNNPKEKTTQTVFAVLHFPLEWLRLMITSSKVLQWILDSTSSSLHKPTCALVSIFKKHLFQTW